jgi:putative hemolysin
VESNDTVDPLIWVVAACAALSCFFALSGHTLRAFRRLQLDEAFGGRTGRRRLKTLEEHLTALRLGTALCRVLANLALVVSLVHLLDGLSGGVRALTAVAMAAGIIAIFGIAIPQAWASYAGEKVLARTLPVLLAFRLVLWPVTAAMAAFDLPIRRLTGARDADEANGEAAKQEILQAATEGQAEGAVDAEEVEMIESVMEFGETQAAEIMTPRTDIFALRLDTPFEEACRKIVDAGHSRVPIYQGNLDTIIGVLYAKDLLRHVNDADVSLRSLMRKPYFVPETKLLDDLLKAFKASKVHIAVVLDEYGGTAGLVSIEDVLEEIVGDIADEYDRAEPALMRRVDATSAEVDGRMYIDDLNDAMQLEIPEDEDYDTVAGFVFSEMGYIPTVGEKLVAQGARFTIVDADERKINSLRVEIVSPDENGTPQTDPEA